MEAPNHSANSNLKMSESTAGKEVYSSKLPIAPNQSVAVSPTPSTPAIIEDEDDLDVPVSPGVKCQRKGCGITFVSDEVNRIGDDEGTICTYHPAPVS